MGVLVFGGTGEYLARWPGARWVLPMGSGLLWNDLGRQAGTIPGLGQVTLMGKYWYGEVRNRGYHSNCGMG